MPGRIFISYRRDDVPGDARGVRDGLAAKFGKSNVFMDVDNLLAGQRFDEELGKALKVCDVFLAVIGPRWMEQLRARTASGDRDYVREEIAAALRRRIVVIPVLVGREGQMPPLPRPGELPDDIRDLVLYQKQDVAHERFGRDMAELVEAVRAARQGGRRALPWRSLAAAGALVAALGGAIAYSGLIPLGAGSAPGTAAPGVPEETSDPTASGVKVERKGSALTIERTRSDPKAAEEAKQKAEGAERQRLALLKAEEDRKRAEAEAKLKTKEELAKRIPRPGQTFRDCYDDDPVRNRACPEMVVVPTGSFTMGSNEFDSEKPLRTVTIRQPFAVGKFEVTFEEWEACVAGGRCQSNRKPSDEGWGRGRRPVINISWGDAKEYVAWLSRKTGKTYRLLTEAEWEYAARAGSTRRYTWDEDIGRSRANCDGCGSQWDNNQTAPVGSFTASAFGVHDMHGNVWEWMEDVWHDNYDGAPSDASAWTQGGDAGRRVLRGGSWFDVPQNLRPAVRGSAVTSGRYDYLGFRVARTLDGVDGSEQLKQAAPRPKAAPGRCITIERGHLFEVEPGSQFCSADGRQNARIVRFREREVFYSTNGGPELMCRFGELCGFDFSSGPVMWQVQSAPNGVTLTFR